MGFEWLLNSVERLKIAQFTFYEHHQTSCINASRADQTALATEHTFIQFDINPLILASAHKGVNLTEVEVRKVARRAGCRTRTATDTSLQLWHFVNNFVTLAQVVAVNIYYAGFAYRKSEIYHLLYSLLIHFTTF